MLPLGSLGGGVCCGQINAESERHGEWSDDMLPAGRLPVGNWGCAEAGGVVYMYYCLCRRVVLLVLTLAQREVEEPTTLCGFGFVSCWEIYTLVCISGSDGGQRVMVFAPPTVRSWEQVAVAKSFSRHLCFDELTFITLLDLFV